MKPWMIVVEVLSVTLILGCSDSTAPMIHDPWIPNDSPDAVVDNFVKAWVYMDIGQYRPLLYDGEEALSGKEDCEAFKFYFIAGSYENPFWGYEDECTHTEALFSGETGANDTPGVESIEMHLNPLSDWTDQSGLDIEGDIAPNACVAKTYYTECTIMLKDTMPGGGNICAFLVDDMIRFYVVPVDVEGEIEYRLWKWIDIAQDKGASDESWGTIKALYP